MRASAKKIIIRIINGGLVLLILSAGGLILLDEVIMPAYTNYKEATTVPDVTKMSLDEAEKALKKKGLRFEVADRRAHQAYPADYIIDQTPDPMSRVKPNRKVYLTVNTAKRPMVIVPEVTNLSLRNAKIQLRNYGLDLGNVSYETARFKNRVLRQSIDPGRNVPKGTVVDLAVSNGLGGKKIRIPEIVGLELTKAQNVLQNAGLSVDKLRFQPSKKFKPNTVISYHPSEKDSIIKGEALSLVIAERYEVKEASESGAVFDSTASGSDSLQNENEKPE